MEPSTLTTQENLELEQHEAIIEHGLRTFMDVGNALSQIRDGRLYREQYGTWEGYLDKRWNMDRSYAHRTIEAAAAVANLLPIGNIIPTNEAQARPLARLEPEQQQEAWAQVVEENPDGKITGAKVQKVVDRMRDIRTDCPLCGESYPIDFDSRGGCPGCQKLLQPKPHVTHNSGNNEWYTPAEYTEAARRVMGTIDLDPASSDKANETVKAATYYTAEIDGLVQEWAGRVWMNPPYASALIGPFCEKLIAHIQTGDVPEACILVNNATETGWFQSLLRSTACICLLKGRIKFIDMDGNPSGAPLQGQVILYAGPNDTGFAQEFEQFGAIFHAW